VKVKNPQGRVDWLACSLLERAMEKNADPVLGVLYQQFKTPLEQTLRKVLNPRRKAMKDIRAAVVSGMKMLQEQQEKRA